MSAQLIFLGCFIAIIVDLFIIVDFLYNDFAPIQGSLWLMVSFAVLRVTLFPVIMRRGGYFGISASSEAKEASKMSISSAADPTSVAIDIPYVRPFRIADTSISFSSAGSDGAVNSNGDRCCCCASSSGKWRSFARQLPMTWLGFNALFLLGVTAALLVLHQTRNGHEDRDEENDDKFSSHGSWNRLAWQTGAGIVATAAQAVALCTLRRMGRKRGRNAAEERHIFLEAIFGDDEGAESEDPDDERSDGGGGGGGGGGDLHFEWLGRLQGRVASARAEWSEKLNQLGDALGSAMASRQESTPQQSDNSSSLLTRLLASADVNTVAPGLLTPEDARVARRRASSSAGIFEVASRLLFQHPTSGSTLLLSEEDALIANLLGLFAADNQLVVGTHLVALDAHDQLRLRAYVPQLLTFLLFGAEGETAVQVQEWLLTKCSVEVPLEDSIARLDPCADISGGGSTQVDDAGVCHFAHACVWFLESHVLSFKVTAMQKAQNIISRPSSTPNLGAAAAAAAAGGTYRELNASWSSAASANRAVPSGHRYSILSDRKKGQGGISQAGRDAVIRLLGEIHHRGKTAANSLLLHNGNGFSSNITTPRMETEEEDAFGETLNFIDALTDLGQYLISIPKAQRNDILRERLQVISEAFLPHNAVYIPIIGSMSGRGAESVAAIKENWQSSRGTGSENNDGCRHRVFALHPDESFAFSTKERVPYLCCVEVIDYALAAEQTRAQEQKGIGREEEKLGEQVVADTNEDGWRSKPRHTEPWARRFGGGGGGDGYGENQNQHQQILAVPRRNSWSGATSLLKSAPLSAHDPFAEGADGDSDESDGDWAEAALASPKTTNPALGQWTTSPKHDEIPVRPNDDNGGGDGDLRRPRANTAPVDFQGASTPRPPTRASIKEGSFDESSDGSSRETITAAHATPQPAPSPPQKLPGIIFKEPWALKEDRLRRHSPIGHRLGWRLLPVIIKSNDDLRQEALVAQLIASADRVFRAPGSGCEDARLRPYSILATSRDAGIIEAVPDTVSIDALKRNDPSYVDLLTFFQRYFRGVGGADDGDGNSVVSLEAARTNFINSLAPYCVICFLLQLKDRHNGNILLDASGYIVHIDFGFIFQSSPGGNLNFESAPFKLTDEMVGLLGGVHSREFATYRRLCQSCFLSLRRHAHQLTLLVDMMVEGHADLPCWQGRPREAAAALRERFQPHLSDVQARAFVNGLVDDATHNWRTTYYDRYQRCCVGIF